MRMELDVRPVFLREPVQVRVCKMVEKCETVQVPRTVCKKVPVCYTVRVPRTVVMKVPVEEPVCDTCG